VTPWWDEGHGCFDVFLSTRENIDWRLGYINYFGQPILLSEIV